MRECLKVQGGFSLSNTIHVSGSKNLAVSLIPASLIAKALVILHNIPPISDVYVLINILRKMNVRVEYDGYTMAIDSTNMINCPLLMLEVKALRASYYFMGVLLGLFKEVTISSPGGCAFESRPINYHLDAFKKMGVTVEEKENLHLKLNIMQTSKVDAHNSVGTTVNILLLSSLLDTETTIINAAKEPEVIELIHFLQGLSIIIKIEKGSSIIVHGKKQLSQKIIFTNIPDRIEAGTFALLGAMVGDELKISPFLKEHNKALLNCFDLIGVPYEFVGKDTIQLSAVENINGVSIETNNYPDFPTDLQQPMTAFLSSFDCTSVIVENVYLNRFTHIQELNKMGAEIHQYQNLIIISGNKDLHGNDIDARDLRGGAALVLAALKAKGTSFICGVKYINRGYESLINKLKAIGAQIEYVEK